MSFGFSVGDIIAVGQLAWTLYRDCYLAARGAPEGFQLLVKEIQTLSGSLNILQEEASNAQSPLVLAGEDRVRMVNEMVERIGGTLKDLQKMATKHKLLGSAAGSRRKQIWAKLSWSLEVSGIDSLRSKVGQAVVRAAGLSPLTIHQLIYHNTVLNLLLTSVGKYAD